MKKQHRKTGRQQQNKEQTFAAPKNISRSGELNEQQVMGAIQRHNQTPFPMLNRSERKLVQQHMVEELSQGFEHRRQALGMVLETRLHSIQEACNHVLVTGKTHLRQQRLEYFGVVFRQVEQRMSRLSDDFLKDMDARYERLGSFKSDVIKKREEQRLGKSVGDFLDTLDQLMDEFRSIISENITHKQVKKEEIIETTQPIDKEHYDDGFGVNDVVDQFMEADVRERYR